MAKLQTLTLLDAQYLGIPIGTTAQRPSPAATGTIRGNTTVGWIEVFDGQNWVPIINAPGDGLTPNTPGRTARAIKAQTGTTTTGFYWIQSEEMTFPVQVYCDMTYDGGGWMLLAYGYVNSAGDDGANRLIPNLNHDGTSFSYTPTSRASAQGLVTPCGAQQTAVKLTRASIEMLYGCGANPSTGGIDNYTYVYKYNIPSPASITYRNHSRYFANQTDITAAGVSTVIVTGLKGDTGTWTRYTQQASLGASWGDSYPTGYGAVSTTDPITGSWDSGPFLPSIHSGSGYPSSYAPSFATSTPDIGTKGWDSGSGLGAGSRSYTYRGWYGAGINFGQTGQMSIWSK